jgi:hypothetical protein
MKEQRSMAQVRNASGLEWREIKKAEISPNRFR